MSNHLTLNIPVDDKLQRKLAALAVLNGQKAAEIQEELESLFSEEIAPYLDQMVTEKIAGVMADMNGDQQPTETQEPRKFMSKFARAEQESQVIDDIAGHSLSGDEDTGAPSLQEQYDQEEAALRETKAGAAPRKPLPAQAPSDDLIPPEIDVPDVGANSEAFLDSALTAPAPTRKQINSFSGRATATGSFNPKTRQARVSDYTGDESGENLF